MRYTTVIDITDLPHIYRNIHARLVYIHMALRAGYHDDDRDVCRLSIRNLAADVGITLSATRNALLQLEKSGLISRGSDCWIVKKWVATETPTPRTQASAAKKASGLSDAMRKLDQEQEERSRQITEWIRTSTITDISELVEKLESGKMARINGQRVYPSGRAIEWFRNQLNQKRKEHER